MYQRFIQKAFVIFSLFFTSFYFHKAAQAQICQPTTDGLVSRYPAEGNADDAQAVNNAALRNGTTFSAGKIGQGFKFDGVDDLVEIPDSASLKPQNVTVEAWVRFDSLFGTTSGSTPNGFQYIVNKKNTRTFDNFEGYSLMKLSNHRLAFSMSANSGFQTTLVDNAQTVEVGQYYHVVGTYDGATARFYVNGRKVGEAAHAAPPGYDTRPVFIGSSGEANWDGKMNGVIDEVKIYNRALPDVEVMGNYLNDNCRADADLPAGLVSWYGGDGDSRDFNGANNPAPFNNQNFIVGKVGQAFRFAGQNSYVKINSSGIFRGQTEGTIETWVRPRSFPTGTFENSAIWTESEELTTSTRFGIYYSAEGRIVAYSNFSQINAVSPFAVPQNEWTHVAATYKAGETVKLYVNGVLAATSPNVGGAFSTEPSAFIGIGALPSGFNDDFLLNGDVDEATVYTRALSADEIKSVFNAGTAGKERTIATNEGTNITSILRDATVAFSNVTTAGETAQTPLEANALPALPQNFAHTGLAYDISTTAVYAGNINVCFNLPALAGENFPRLKILHLENGAWIDRTTANNPPQLCGQVSNLSPFVIAENLAPTAASVSIAGRAFDGKRGIGGVRVTLTNATGETRTTLTNPFGFYRFADVPAGKTYFVTAFAKRYFFTNPTQVLFVGDVLTDVDFIAGKSFLNSKIFQPESVQKKSDIISMRAREFINDNSIMHISRLNLGT